MPKDGVWRFRTRYTGAVFALSRRGRRAWVSELNTRTNEYEAGIRSQPGQARSRGPFVVREGSDHNSAGPRHRRSLSRTGSQSPSRELSDIDQRCASRAHSASEPCPGSRQRIAIGAAGRASQSKGERVNRVALCAEWIASPSTPTARPRGSNLEMKGVVPRPGVEPGLEVPETSVMSVSLPGQTGSRRNQYIRDQARTTARGAAAASSSASISACRRSASGRASAITRSI